LATGCAADASILLWDLPLLFLARLPSRPAAKPEALWDELASKEAMRAHRALWRLVALVETDTFLSRRLAVVERMPAERLRVLLAQLNSDDFTVREKAEQDLSKAGESIAAGLEDTHRNAKDLELRRRLERLRSRLPVRAPDRLREMRAVMVLEVRGTQEARRLLRRLAGGAPEALLTQEAKAALARLQRQKAR
jgi:hypothetical protein